MLCAAAGFDDRRGEWKIGFAEVACHLHC
jgi:hypothetical protein